MFRSPSRHAYETINFAIADEARPPIQPGQRSYTCWTEGKDGQSVGQEVQTAIEEVLWSQKAGNQWSRPISGRPMIDRPWSWIALDLVVYMHDMLLCVKNPLCLHCFGFEALRTGIYLPTGLQPERVQCERVLIWPFLIYKIIYTEIWWSVGGSECGDAGCADNNQRPGKDLCIWSIQSTEWGVHSNIIYDIVQLHVHVHVHALIYWAPAKKRYFGDVLCKGNSPQSTCTVSCINGWSFVAFVCVI